MLEIERKFTIDIQKWNEIVKPEPIQIVQSYLSTTPECTVRVRIKGKKGFLTIKGKTNGISRSEFEYEIPLEEAQQIIASFSEKTLSKLRYEIQIENHLWEVDVFQGKLDGLIIAEIELKSENEEFTKPDWIIEDVSDNSEYYNSRLIEKC
jgi:CYTH domain-containing protein